MRVPLTSAVLLAALLFLVPDLRAGEDDHFQPTADLIYLETGATARIPVLDNDGGGARAVVSCGAAARGQVDCSNDSHIRYHPDQPLLGVDSFTYTARGTDWRTASALVHLVFVPGPTARPFDDVFTVAAGRRTLLDVRANDKIAPWASPTAVVDTTLEAGRHRLTADPASGLLAFQPERGFTGRAVFSYRLVDEERGFSSALAYVTVDVTREGAESPQAESDRAVVHPGTPRGIAVLANDFDPEGSGLALGHWDPVSRAGGTIEEGPEGTLVYTPPEGFVGTDEWTYFALDAAGRTSNRTTVVLSVETDLPPRPAHDTASTLEDTAVVLDVLANDVDPEGLPLTVTTLGSPLYGTAQLEPDGTVRFTPAADRSGIDFFTYTVSDPGGQSATARVTVSITPVDDPPRAAPDTVSTDEEIGVSIAVLANDLDPEHAALSLVSVGPAASGTPCIKPGQTIFYLPGPDFFGIDTFEYTVSDGGLEASTTVTVNVANRPDPPVAVDDTASTREGELVSIDVLANDLDPDRGTLTVSGLLQGTGGTADLRPDGTVEFQPALGFTGQGFFEYRIANDSGFEDSALVVVDISPDGTPHAISDEVSTLEEQPVRIDVLANDWDPNGDTLQLVSAGPAVSGTTQIDIGPDLYPTVLFTPDLDFFGIATFKYAITDGTVNTSGLVTVTVEPLPDFPDLLDDTARTFLDTPRVINVLANDRDPDGGTLAVVGHSQPFGTLELRLDGTFLYQPPSGFTGTDAFFYTARSSGNMEGVARVEIYVTMPDG